MPPATSAEIEDPSLRLREGSMAVPAAICHRFRFDAAYRRRPSGVSDAAAAADIVAQPPNIRLACAAPPPPSPDSNWPMKLWSLPPVGVVRDMKSNTLPSCMP